jgi:hypothetical protein
LRDNPYESKWWYRLQNNGIRDSESRDGKEFRRDFRVPFSVFHYIYEQAKVAKKEDGSFLWPEQDSLGLATHPLSLKILAWLYILGRGVPFRSCEDTTGIDEDSIRVFFHAFNSWMVVRFFEEWVRETYVEQLDKIVEAYEKLGHPGAGGSTDVVHIPWDCCPYEYRVMNKGKEGFPTRAFEVTVSHDRYIRWVAGSFPGAWNDKIIARFDGLVTRFKRDPTFLEYQFKLFRKDGSSVVFRSLYLITDNGYHHWRCMIPPMTVTTDHDEMIWSKHLESIRKDVECTFGILKRRFRILKIPLLYHEVECVDNVFYTCSILHNMLLKWDGLAMEEDENEEGYGDLTDDIVGDGTHRAGNSVGYRNQHLHQSYDATRHGQESIDCHFIEPPPNTMEVEADVDFSTFRSALVEHYAYVKEQQHHDNR